MGLIERIKNGQLKEQIEESFGQWGHITHRYRWWIIALVTVLCLGLFSQLKHIQFDGTFSGFFYKDDPALQVYDAFREQYGRDDNIIILMKHQDIFNQRFLETLRALHQQLEQNTPYLMEVDSLYTARHTLGVGDTLVVDDFLKDWPESEAQLKQLKKTALANPNYIGTYLSADGQYAAIHVKNQGFISHADPEDDLLSGFDDTPVSNIEKSPLSFIEEGEVRASIDKTLAQFKDSGYEILIAGGAYTTSALVQAYSEGMMTYTGFAILLIGILLFAIFRRLTMVFLPLLVAFLAMLSSLSLMAVMGIPISFSMQIVPSFLIAVGVGNSVHIFTIYYQAIDHGESKLDALVYSLQHTGLAIVLTGLTTAGGLVSFLSSHMKPIAEFGAITPLGILFTLFFSLVLLPALIAVIPVKQKQVLGNKLENSLIEKLVQLLGRYSVQYPKRVITMWAVFVFVSLIAATQIKFSFWVLRQLPADHEVVLAINEIDKNFSGIIPLEFIVDSGRENGVKDPEFLKKLDQVNELIKTFEYEGNQFVRAISIVNINKELHQALNQNNTDFYSIPDDPLLVSQELLLFENSGADDLQKVVDSQFRYARLTIAANTIDAVTFQPMLAEFLIEFEKIFPGYAYEKTGVLDLNVSIFNELYVSMAKSYVIAFMVITPLMILLIGSIRVGLLCMIPNLSPIIVTLGMMGIFGIDLTTATLLVGSIAMGLVVDDTIHFMHNFRRYFQRGQSVQTAVHNTLQSTGIAITFTTLVLSAAFMVFMFNTMIDWAYFGVVASFCIFVALLADITLAPALLAALYKNHPQQSEAHSTLITTQTAGEQTTGEQVHG